MTIKEANKIRKSITGIVENLSDEDALSVTILFEPWKTGIDYKIDDRIKFNDNLYKCIQAHTSQSDWTPDITPALWKIVSIEEWPEWIQPTGAHDAYSIGDKVSYNGKHWISTVDGNVWAPGVYGWDEV